MAIAYYQTVWRFFFKQDLSPRKKIHKMKNKIFHQETKSQTSLQGYDMLARYLLNECIGEMVDLLTRVARQKITYSTMRVARWRQTMAPMHCGVICSNYSTNEYRY